MIDTGEELGICAINVAEFYSGVPVSERTIWDDFIGALAYWEITRDGATKAGHDRHGFLQRGQTLSTTDALVAAVAREQQATLVTDNTNDYPMTDIVLLSLRE
jgi:predicted nucleic acid-binding protein